MCVRSSELLLTFTGDYGGSLWVLGVKLYVVRVLVSGQAAQNALYLVLEV